jgi:hypothetical protein
VSGLARLMLVSLGIRLRRGDIDPERDEKLENVSVALALRERTALLGEEDRAMGFDPTNSSRWSLGSHC